MISSECEAERLRMVTSQLVTRGIRDERVLAAMKKVPRHLFVPEGLSDCAYDDGPLSIGEGQTISQPYMVALMTEALALTGAEKVLEVGTGSGYQTAVLAELSGSVYTVERIPLLSQRSQNLLSELGYSNVLFQVGDGSHGWPEMAPYQRILVTAGAPDVCQSLVHRLEEGGIMVLPVGTRYSQMLYRITKKKDKIEKEELTLCIFVPLVGEHGWKEA
jgi:protein-L-isoaspartate(D-aspartate) O-methyltransferase